jgi:hypothetical protein
MINKILCAMFFTRVSEIEVCGIKKSIINNLYFYKVVEIQCKPWTRLYFNNNFEITVMI